MIRRERRPDGLIGNFPSREGEPSAHSESQIDESSSPKEDHFSEDSLKARIRDWLEADGWQVRVAWRKEKGIDIEASRQGLIWRIEVKGRGSRPQMRVNYFQAILGELLQRLDDTGAKYSIALPGMPQYRNLWKRLPSAAKRQLGLTALFVEDDGRVVETTA